MIYRPQGQELSRDLSKSWAGPPRREAVFWALPAPRPHRQWIWLISFISVTMVGEMILSHFHMHFFDYQGGGAWLHVYQYFHSAYEQSCSEEWDERTEKNFENKWSLRCYTTFVKNEQWSILNTYFKYIPKFIRFLLKKSSVHVYKGHFRWWNCNQENKHLMVRYDKDLSFSPKTNQKKKKKGKEKNGKPQRNFME